MSLIDREALIAEYDRVHVGAPGGTRKLMVDAPEVRPDDAALHESCTDCPLYDHDKHRCPRLNKVIPDTLREIQDTQPRMRGKWKTGVNENGVTTSLFCSECNYENKHWYEWNYCPHCGADMREEEQE